MGVLRYSPNNSGGHWWLDTEAYERLEKTGWTVHWAHEKETAWGRGPDVVADVYEYKELLKPVERNKDLNYMGAEAGSCAKAFPNPEMGVQEWQRIVGQSAAEMGCNCCGPPHNFSWYDDNGDETYMHTNFPTEGTWSF